MTLEAKSRPAGNGGPPNLVPRILVLVTSLCLSSFVVIRVFMAIMEDSYSFSAFQAILSLVFGLLLYNSITKEKK